MGIVARRPCEELAFRCVCYIRCLLFDDPPRLRRRLQQVGICVVDGRQNIAYQEAILWPVEFLNVMFR
jgi:hypothetical protein